MSQNIQVVKFVSIFNIPKPPFIRYYSKILMVILLLSSAMGYAQELRTSLDSLRLYSQEVTLPGADFKKYEANEKFKVLLEKTFHEKDSFTYPFDSVKTLSSQTSPDNKFKIITWGIARENGTYEYFGYLLFPDNKHYPNKFLILTDNTEKIKSPETQITDNANWYGAIYYRIVMTRYQGKKYYTLLGWKGNNLITTKKVLEVLSFRSSGTPVFGAPLFRKYKDKTTRVIFEYSSQATMLLRYEKQMVHVITKPAHTSSHKVNPKDRNSGKAMKATHRTEAKQKTIKTNMILFDRLSPIDPRTSKYAVELEGQYQFYAPETNVLDAFVFTNGKWIFTKDIDARNPEKKKINPKDLPKPEDYDSGSKNMK